MGIWRVLDKDEISLIILFSSGTLTILLFEALQPTKHIMMDLLSFYCLFFVLKTSLPDRTSCWRLGGLELQWLIWDIILCVRYWLTSILGSPPDTSFTWKKNGQLRSVTAEMVWTSDIVWVTCDPLVCWVSTDCCTLRRTLYLRPKYAQEAGNIYGI